MATNHDNVPTLTALAYRLDTHPTFLARMIERLHQQTVAADGAQALAARPLAALTTRDPDDPALALLDAWAVVGDVLTFYQERIANEGYLRTSTEARSIHELARATGYELRPGLAASVALAFTLATAPGMDAVIQIDAGLKVQSIPGQDQQPQTFETVEAIAARPEWNALGIAAPPLTTASKELRLAGVTTGLRLGDRLLLVGAQPGQRYLPTLKSVEPDPHGAFTRVTWDQPLATGDSVGLTTPQVFALRQRATLFRAAARRWYSLVRYPLTGNGALTQQALSALPLRALATYQQGQIVYLFAGVAGGGVLRSPDQGVTWQPCNVGLTNLMIQALFADERHWLYAGSTDGAIFRSTDNGDSWSQITTGSVVHTKYVGTDGKLLKNADDTTREEWGQAGLPKTTIHALGGYVVQNNNLPVYHLLAATDDGVYVTTNEGATWEHISPLPGIQALVAQADEKHLLGTYDGLYRSGTQSTFVALPGLRALARAGSSLTLWIGIETGLHQIDTNNLGNLPNMSPLYATQGIRALTARADGTVFAAIALGAETDRPDAAIGANGQSLALDGVYNTMVKDSWVVLVNSDQEMRAYRVADVTLAPRDALTSTTQVTHLVLADGTGLLDFAGQSQRALMVLAQSEPLALFVDPQPQDGAGPTSGSEPVTGSQLLLDRQIPALNRGRRLLVSGKAPGVGENDPRIGEVVLVESTRAMGEQTLLILQSPGLQNIYARATVTLYANVARATHGETIASEVLGSGDGAQANQRFALKHTPLTYVPAPTASGAASTLTVRVNQVTWAEAPSLHDLQPRSQHYILRQEAEGRTSLIFGNGQQGARLPSGMENVVATYRTGLGPAGNVNAESLTLLQTRPLGVQEVTNPLAASGGTAPEPGDVARQNAPLRVLTMDRLVALADFEDFARTFAGIELAQATLLWVPGARPVHLTIAGSNGSAVDSGSALYQALAAAIDQRRKQTQPVIIASYTAVPFMLKARLYLDARYAAATVAAAVRAALLDAFQFKQRTFGQDVAPSQVITVIQAVPGVVAVNLLALQPKTSAPVVVRPAHGGAQPQANSDAPTVLHARLARWDTQAQRTQPAELLVLDENGIELEDANSIQVETVTTP